MATRFTYYDDGEPEPGKNGSNGNGHKNGKPANGQPASGELVPANGHAGAEVDIRIRDAQILDLRSQGWPVQAIADQFGLSKSTTHKAIRRALAYIPSPAAEEVRRMADIAMDRSLRKLADVLSAEHYAVSQGKVVTHPDTGEPILDSRPIIEAAREIREHWESRRKMHGADAPSKSVTAALPQSVIADRIRELQKTSGTAGITDPAVRELLGISEPLEDIPDDDGE